MGKALREGEIYGHFGLPFLTQNFTRFVAIFVIKRPFLTKLGPEKQCVYPNGWIVALWYQKGFLPCTRGKSLKNQGVQNVRKFHCSKTGFLDDITLMGLFLATPFDPLPYHMDTKQIGCVHPVLQPSFLTKMSKRMGGMWGDCETTLNSIPLGGLSPYWHGIHPSFHLRTGWLPTLLVWPSPLWLFGMLNSQMRPENPSNRATDGMSAVYRNGQKPRTLPTHLKHTSTWW